MCTEIVFERLPGYTELNYSCGKFLFSIIIKKVDQLQSHSALKSNACRRKGWVSFINEKYIIIDMVAVPVYNVVLESACSLPGVWVFPRCLLKTNERPWAYIFFFFIPVGLLSLWHILKIHFRYKSTSERVFTLYASFI